MDKRAPIEEDGGPNLYVCIEQSRYNFDPGVCTSSTPLLPHLLSGEKGRLLQRKNGAEIAFYTQEVDTTSPIQMTPTMYSRLPVLFYAAAET